MENYHNTPYRPDDVQQMANIQFDCERMCDQPYGAKIDLQFYSLSDGKSKYQMQLPQLTLMTNTPLMVSEQLTLMSLLGTDI